MPSAEPEYETLNEMEQAPWAEIVSAADTPPQAQARQLKAPGPQRQSVKFVAKCAFVAFGCAVIAVVWNRSSTMEQKSTAASGNSEDIVEEFGVTLAECQNHLRWHGCEKESWGCTKAYAPDNGYRCCCETKIWPHPKYEDWKWSHPTSSSGTDSDDEGVSLSSGASAEHADRGAFNVLRLEKASSKVCLAGPEEDEGEFSLQECTDSGTLFKLPPRGAGPIELGGLKKHCLTVADKGSHKLLVKWCTGAPEQQFQLTNGDKGMLQWSHGGNKCLDSENGGTEKLSKMVLADCVYWPEKPSQVFVLEDPPKKVKKEKKEKKEKKDEDGDDEEDDEDKDKDEDEDEDKHKVKKKEFEAPKVHPSLFCTSLMLPWSYEVDMLRTHLKMKIGIFACTTWAVYSNKKVKLADGKTPEEDVYNDIMNGTLRAKRGGAFHTFMNTPVFVRFWARLIEDGRPFKHDWTIKADPDSVFFPDRLTEMLKNTYYMGQAKGPVWLNNCQLGLHGPIEVFNNWTFHIYANDPSKCDSEAEKHGQEDVFLRHCFSKLKIPKRDAFNLLFEADWACNERPVAMDSSPPCYDQQVTFHPFKSVESYLSCYKKAAPMTWSTPLTMNAVPPSSANHHHA